MARLLIFIREMIIQHTLFLRRLIVSLSLSLCVAVWCIACVLISYLGIKVIEAGLGQRHAFSGTSAMTYLSLGTRSDIPAEYLLIYAPRTEAEIEIVMQIIAASVKFMTGREDVR